MKARKEHTVLPIVMNEGIGTWYPIDLTHDATWSEDGGRAVDA